MNIFSNYLQLVGKVDELSRRVSRQFPDAFRCGAGCDGCCRHITVFPVEAVHLAMALRQLPAEQAEPIRAEARKSDGGEPCPLLHGKLCLLYPARPLICRTQGLPLLTGTGERRSIDFCRLNFQGMEQIPGEAVLDLERLNAVLSAVNAHFVAEVFQEPPEKGRFTIAEALLLEF